MDDNFEQMSRSKLIEEIRRLTELQKKLADIESIRIDTQIQEHELRVQQEQLEESQHLLEASRDAYAELYDFAPVAYLTLDQNGIIQELNLTACSLLNFERGRIIGFPLLSHISEAYRPSFLDHMRRCRSGEQQVNTELEVKLRSSRKIPVLLSSRIAHKGKLDAIRTVVVDLSERRAAESKIREINATLEERVLERTAELEKTNQELTREIIQRQAAEKALHESHARKDEFIAMLGHELRNPLAPLQHAIELWRMGNISENQLNEIQEIADRQVQHMSQVVNDLLDVSRINQGKIQLRDEQVNLVKIIEDVGKDFEDRFDKKKLSLITDVPSDPVWVQGDSLRLAQVLTNLLHNSYKFTPPGGNINVTLKKKDSFCTLYVRDNGMGIDPTMIGQLFSSFTQSKRELDRSMGGLGLGLALVKGIVELHNGIVTAESSGINRGTTFLIQLPSSSDCLKGVENVTSGEDTSRTFRILLIDDQRDSLYMISTLLKRLGHTVATAQNGNEALRTAKSFQPEIVFSDIGLPGMNGYEIARRIRSDPALQVERLFAMTGYGQLADKEAAYQAGFHQHLTKPVGINDLIRILNEMPHYHS